MGASADTVGARAQARVPTRHARTTVASRNAWRHTPAALVLALVVGILGMHALAAHGTAVTEGETYAHSMAATHTHGAAMSDTGMVMSTTADAVHPSQALASSSHHAEHTATAGTPAHDGPGHSSMVMLCVFILLGAAVALLGLLAGGLLRRPLLPDAFQPAPLVARLRRWAGGTGPPPVWQFSVIRC